jgi:hypothetical protein
MTRKEHEPDLPKPPLVREGSYRSKCHGAECIKTAFWATDSAGHNIDVICHVVQCHAHIPRDVTVGDTGRPGDDGLKEMRTVPCFEPQGVVRAHMDKHFGISTKTICDLARKGIFSVHIAKKETASAKVGIERALLDEF